MEIAITGAECRFPGGPDRDAFWRLLLAGGDGVGAIPADRWDAEALLADSGDVDTREGGFINDPDSFDNELFGISPAEAKAMDPQQRLLLEIAWQALEDAGLDPATQRGTSMGVFVGVMGNEWARARLPDHRAITPYEGGGNGYCMTANRLSYQLGLNGPSMAVDTACSSSLVAVHLACAALDGEECEQAIAAGVNLILSPLLNVFYARAGLAAPDGRCKPFGIESNGIGRAEGVGAVVLRPLADALTAGDRILATIRGGAVNHNGRSNGLTAPSRWAQSAAIERAYKRAGVDADEIDFVEAHGTGTALGDLIEVKALGQLHASRAEHPCLLGSVKGNIGHAEGAAGIAALIKAALALDRRLVPPNRHGRSESPRLRLRLNGLALVEEPEPLPMERALAGVSSFGLGGTNAHVVLESAPVRVRSIEPTHESRERVGVLTVSGNDLGAVRRNASVLAEGLRADPGLASAAVCRTSNRVKSSLPWKLGVAAADRDTLLAELDLVAADESAAANAVGHPAGEPRVGFLLSGQGSQHPGMTKALADACPQYRTHLESADAALRDQLGVSIVELMLSEEERVRETRFAQPAIFAVQYALGHVLADFGIRPQAILGHSVGELAGACLAGALPLVDAARLVVARGALMQELPPGGGMLAVEAGAEDLGDLVDLHPLVVVAAFNGPRSLTLSGDLEALGEIAAILRGRGIATAALDVSHAFHSPLMKPMLEPFRRLAGEVSASEAEIEIISSVTAESTLGTALDAEYWTAQVRAPVDFDRALATVAAGLTHLVELGPRPVLIGLARRNPAAKHLTCLSATSPKGDGTDLAALVARLYRDGLTPRWSQLYGSDVASRVQLHPYAFSKKNRFWLDSEAPRSVTVAKSQRRVEGGVAEVVVAAICEVTGQRPDLVVPSARLAEDLGLDSVMLMMLKQELDQLQPALAELEVEAFLPHLDTVGALTRFIAETVDGDVASAGSAQR